MKFLTNTLFIMTFWLRVAGIAAGPDDDKVSARAFAGPDQKLNREEAALYIVYRDKEPVSKFIPPGKLTMDPRRVVEAMSDKLNDLVSSTNHDAPWTWQELDHAFPPKKNKAEQDAAIPGWQKITGVTKIKELGKDGVNGHAGPFTLRKSTDEFGKDLKDSKGATLSYSSNQLVKNGGAWNSQGALQYPFEWINGPYDVGGGPAVDWNLVQTQGAAAKNIQSLNFSFPLNAYVYPPEGKEHPESAKSLVEDHSIDSSMWILQGKPYFETDFSWRYKIYGAQASAEYIGGLFDSNIYVGGYYNSPIDGLQYQLRVVPQLDYSVTEEGGEYTTRKKGDDWLRLGGLTSFDVRIGGVAFNPVNMGISYQLMQKVNGPGGYSYLLKPYATLWLSPNAGLTLSYSKGTTPVADKRIDLLTLGLELKY